jgi:hypothetical protein
MNLLDELNYVEDLGSLDQCNFQSSPTDGAMNTETTVQILMIRPILPL